MNEGLKKFRELLLTDGEFQQKLKNAAEAYAGEQTEEAFFENVLVPAAAEYGIAASYDEFKDYILSMADVEMNTEEIAQVAGGDSKGGGIGGIACAVVGIGAGGGAGGESGGVCAFIGAGWGKTSCVDTGKSVGI